VLRQTRKENNNGREWLNKAAYWIRDQLSNCKKQKLSTPGDTQTEIKRKTEEGPITERKLVEKYVIVLATWQTEQ
jgi:hypothetical protein